MAPTVTAECLLLSFAIPVRPSGVVIWQNLALAMTVTVS